MKKRRGTASGRCPITKQDRLMNILLVGEASNLHWTLAEGLRALGHSVTVVSDGSSWMNNRRNIDIARKSNGLFDSVSYLARILRYLPRFKGYDVVQVKGPIFFNLRPEKNLAIFNYLRKHNRKIFLDASGLDYYYSKACFDGKSYRYSDYFIGDKPLNTPDWEERRKAYFGPIRRPNIEMAQQADGIIACLYEYFVAYEPEYKDKLAYIPIPIQLDQHPMREIPDTLEKVRFFIGIQQKRSAIKGTDVMYDVLQQVQAKYPDECEIKKVVSVPYAEYNKMLYDSDILIDQLYSYTPATNALGAMAKGLVAVSGAEPEFYDFIGEHDLQPVVNILPDRDAVFSTFENLILQKERLAELSRQSRAFVEKHHDHIQVAKQYVDFWNSK